MTKRTTGLYNSSLPLWERKKREIRDHGIGEEGCSKREVDDGALTQENVKMEISWEKGREGR